MAVRVSVACVAGRARAALALAVRVMAVRRVAAIFLIMAVRAVAVQGVCRILNVFWEIVPATTAKTMLLKLVDELVRGVRFFYSSSAPLMLLLLLCRRTMLRQLQCELQCWMVLSTCWTVPWPSCRCSLCYPLSALCCTTRAKKCAHPS